MADQNISQYKYSAMSNLVLQADRRFISRVNDEPTGDPESLAGRISIREMGGRMARDDAPKTKKKTIGPTDIERGAIREGEDVLAREQRKTQRGQPAQLRGQGILSAADALIEGLKYRPRTPATRATYDLILTMTATHLGDVPHEVVRSAADAVLELLKDEEMKDFDKKKEIDDLLGSSMNPKEFNELVNLGKKITDYDAQDEDEEMGEGLEGEGEGELDERQGVAVVFDEEDEDDERMGTVDEIRDDDELSEDEEADQQEATGIDETTTEKADLDGLEEAEEMVIDGGLGRDTDRRDKGSTVPAREIDAYWLQRQIGAAYSDAHIQHEKATQALEILGGQGEDGAERPLRDVENDLMELFDYENPDLVAKLVTNRDKIVWVTRWRRVAEDADARHLVESEMVEAGHRQILDEIRVGNLGKRLEPYGIKVAELSGDRQLTKQQIAETQIIVTTPEKFDVITRKASETSYTRLVRLVVIDEIHLLHDDRGPVIESIVSRTIRKVEQTGDPVRIVGLSATLPNYRDVASFLRVDPLKGLFHFDGSYRPCPLKQEFIGVTDKKAIKQLKTMNDICYNKVLEQVGQRRNQMLIFVHSRKETAKTAKYIRDKALEMETIGQILRSDAASRAILAEEAETVDDPSLKDLLPYGLGIHHAGLSLADRDSVQALFSDGSIQVLVCTATLAWGVNLPAHTVIIKGTQIYSPEKGSWVELSPQDVLQMLGRAGRPQYDTFGEGIIITSQTEIQYYLSLMNQQLPIESQLMSKLADNMNAEIVLGNIRTRDEGVDWLGYTYLFVRMLRSPGLYSVGADYEDDEALEQKRVDLVHSAAVILERAGLVKYDKKTGRLQSTELGRIASHYYIGHNSMLTYSQHIQPSITPIELFRIFALSDEFKYIPVRQDEKLELAKLLGRVPVPVKEGIDEPHSKINVLLQAYISRLKLEGLALMADMVYVTQSAGRILRALFEISLKKGWSSVAKTALNLCKMAERRMWPTMTPLRQFPTCPRDILQKAERIDVPWASYFDLDPPRMGELLGMPKAGRVVCDLVSKFPRLEVQAQVQPVTRSMLRVELTITPNFVWDEALHGNAQDFWILVEDCDGEEILFHDQFLLRGDIAQSEMNEHLVEFTVPITEPMPPNYFISLVSDRWMHSETKIAVSFQKLILPERFPPHTPLLDMQRAPIKALKRDEYQQLYPEWQYFNKIQTQTFKSLFDTDDNVFIGAPTGSGKTVCAELALLRHWAQEDSGRAVYIAPFQELVDQRLVDWEKRLSNIAGGKTIVKLTGETTADLRLLERADLVLATPTQWDVLSRQWRKRKNVRAVQLFIADEIQMLGGYGGYVYEVVVSRMHSMALETESGMRIVGLSVPLANARDLGEWIGANKHTIYNFSPHARPVPLELHIQSFTIPHFPSLMLAMARPAYLSILQLSPDKPAIVFVPSRKQTRSTAMDLLAACATDDDEDRFLNADVNELAPLLSRINERTLAESLSHGIGYYHEALSATDKRIVSHLFSIGAIQVLLASRDVCWELDLTAHLVVVMGTQFFEGREHRYIDYPISEILQMFGKASRPGEDKIGRGVLMVPAVKREYYKKFLNEALPVESHLQAYLHDAFVTEISTRTIGSTQDAIDWMTHTYFYRRLLANPSFYGLADVSHEGLSTFLSELLENTLKELSDAKIVDLDEEDDSVSPLNAAMIGSYYNISFITMQTFLLSLSARTKLKGILEIVTSATEFESIQMRRHEDHILRRVYDRVPVKMSQVAYDSPHFKAFVLLQAHFSPMDPSENKDYATLVKRLGLDNRQLAQAAAFTNEKYPNLELDFEVEDPESVTSGEPSYLKVKIEREVEEDEEPDTSVHAPFYPNKKMENWWLVVGDEKTKNLLAIKRITIGRKLELRLEYIVPTPGEHELTLYLMSDSYVGVDQAPTFTVTAAEGMDEDEDEEEEDEE
ncbi:pre-mRNA splicing helicase [Aspergillus luchuensis]|uniref:Pre-mRNA splicing helicase n=1 Tax=Aspergillus kawachii TaxID=1069201 RepID=A0A146FTX9_ASPKA|nr:pre-mRNA splicing helicase [Aspergillus luchuensis]